MTGPRTRLHIEIDEQAAVIARLVERMTPAIPDLRAWLATTEIDHVMMVARGSSDNVARYGQYLLGITCRLPVSLAAPSLQSVYGVSPRLGRSLAVAISQSGRSPDVVGVLQAARDQRRPTLAITNDPTAPLAGVADHVVDLAAGEERSVAATKTYTSSLVAMALLAVALGDPDEATDRLRELSALPDIVDEVLAGTPTSRADALVDTTHLLVAGRGLNYGTSFEAALKIRELTGTVAEAFSPPDLLHGPIAAVEKGADALLIAPAEPSLEGQRALLPALRERGARIATISADTMLLEQADLAFPLVREPAAWLTPVTAILPAQLIAAHIAAGRGLDLDRPTGLSKVTETS